MLTKITFYAYNQDDISIGRPQCIIIDDNTKEQLGDEVATFNEYHKIVAEFESTDSNAILEIDSSISETPLQIKPGSPCILISSAKDQDSMLTPGYYGFQVVTSTKLYEGLFLIKPTSVSWNGLINIRNYLEKVMNGLSHNLYIQKMAGQKNIYGDNDYSINKLYFYINNNIDTVSANIENIIKNPMTDIKKDYREQHYSTCSSMKSQKWLCTKGINKNKNIYAPDTTYEKHAELNRDVLENQWIKKILTKTIEIICSAENKYQIILNDILRKTKEKDKAYTNKYQDYQIIKYNLNISKEHKYILCKELEYLQHEINKLKANCSFVEDIVNNLKKIKSLLLHFLYETWFNEITDDIKKPKVSYKLLKDKRYYSLYDFYFNILSIENNDTLQRKPYFPSKKTSQLFEYYVLAAVIQILVDENFIWESGWLAENKSEEIYNGEIPTNKPMIFIKDKYRCELWYEKKIETSTVVSSKNINDFVRMNARHYKPDLLLSIFDNTTDTLLISLVIEVKCRYSKNLHSNYGPTSVIEQARDYFSFGYYSKNAPGINKTRRAVIDEVIIVYPKQNQIIETNYPDITLSFIQMEALDIEDISKHYGYDKLKQKIDNCLEHKKA